MRRVQRRIETNLNTGTKPNFAFCELRPKVRSVDQNLTKIKITKFRIARIQKTGNRPFCKNFHRDRYGWNAKGIFFCNYNYSTNSIRITKRNFFLLRPELRRVEVKLIVLVYYKMTRAGNFRWKASGEAKSTRNPNDNRLLHHSAAPLGNRVLGLFAAKNFLFTWYVEAKFWKWEKKAYNPQTIQNFLISKVKFFVTRFLH